MLLERERVRQLRMHALEALAEKLAAAGRYGEAVQAAYAAVVAEPLRESAHRAVVRVHLVEGNVAEAVRAYDSFRTMLAEELGRGPLLPDGPAGLRPAAGSPACTAEHRPRDAAADAAVTAGWRGRPRLRRHGDRSGSGLARPGSRA